MIRDNSTEYTNDWGHFFDPDKSDDEQKIKDFKDQSYLKSQENISLAHNKIDDPSPPTISDQINYNSSWNDTITTLSITSFLIVILAIIKNEELLNFLSDKNFDEHLGVNNGDATILL
jgi:hypothetical protein